MMDGCETMDGILCYDPGIRMDGFKDLPSLFYPISILYIHLCLARDPRYPSVPYTSQ